jgi:hypothetical protein
MVDGEGEDVDAIGVEFRDIIRRELQPCRVLVSLGSRRGKGRRGRQTRRRGRDRSWAAQGHIKGNVMM